MCVIFDISEFRTCINGLFQNVFAKSDREKILWPTDSCRSTDKFDEVYERKIARRYYTAVRLYLGVSISKSKLHT